MCIFVCLFIRVERSRVAFWSSKLPVALNTTRHATSRALRLGLTSVALGGQSTTLIDHRGFIHSLRLRIEIAKLETLSLAITPLSQASLSLSPFCSFFDDSAARPRLAPFQKF